MTRRPSIIAVSMSRCKLPIRAGRGDQKPQPMANSQPLSYFALRLIFSCRTRRVQHVKELLHPLSHHTVHAIHPVHPLLLLLLLLLLLQQPILIDKLHHRRARLG